MQELGVAQDVAWVANSDKTLSFNSATLLLFRLFTHTHTHTQDPFFIYSLYLQITQ